jgi:hypothetical protein
MYRLRIFVDLKNLMMDLLAAHILKMWSYIAVSLTKKWFGAMMTKTSRR